MTRDLLAVAFVDVRHGWVATARDKVLATSDGGRSWHLQALQARPSYATTVAQPTNPLLPQSLAFAAPNRGWVLAAQKGVGGVTETLFRTGDGGRIWQQGPDLAGSPAFIFFLNPHRGWMSVAGGVEATLDGGIHWALYPTPLQAGNGALAFADPEHGWDVGAQGGIAMTTNGGRTWTAHDMGSYTFLNAVAAVSSQRAIAVGDDGTILQLGH